MLYHPIPHFDDARQCPLAVRTLLRVEWFAGDFAVAIGMAMAQNLLAPLVRHRLHHLLSPGWTHLGGSAVLQVSGWQRSLWLISFGPASH